MTTKTVRKSRVKVFGGSANVLLHHIPDRYYFGFDEKISTHLSKIERRDPEIQDVYDMFTLKDRVPKPSGGTLDGMRSFLRKMAKSPPKNENELQALLLSGVVPTFDYMLSALKDWLHDRSK